LVPSFADWFAFHVFDESHARLVTWQASAAVKVGASFGGDWSEAVADAVGHGAPVLGWGRTMVGEAFRPARALDLTSILIAPVIVRDMPIATMTFGTAGRRRGYRRGDVATADDLSARVGVAMECVVLGAETQQSAVRTARHA